MMKERLIVSILEIIIGLSLVVASIFGAVDEYWSDMGTTLLIVGILFLAKTIKYKTNQEYREEYDIKINDERNKYISMKAWSWAGYLFVISAAVASIGFKIVEREDLMRMASGSVCLVMLFYWISYMVLKKKY